MDGFGVAELAERAGVPASTVRFYEREGLLSPARRSVNGYRVFDEAAVEELAFIRRAKGIGMTLEDIAELLTTWPNGECRSLQARLRAFLAERIDEVHQKLGEQEAFERQLRDVLGRSAARDPGPERCGKGCGCEANLDIGAARPEPRARTWGCSLDGDALTEPIAQWRATAATAISVQRSGDSVRLRFPPRAATIAALAGLCAAETVCCTQTRFVSEVTADELVLIATAPGSPELLDVLFSLHSVASFGTPGSR